MSKRRFSDKGDPQALRLEFQSYLQCEHCHWDHHILYYFHRTLVCGKCLKKSGVPYTKVTMGGVTLYKLVKVEEE